MTTKLLKGALTRFTVMAIAAVFFIPVASAATSSGDMDNPVTGETKTYDYKYVGSGTWTASDWQDANGAALAAAPGTDNSNLWGSMLVNCSNPISVAQLNGWELQLGVFGGANVTVGELGFWTGSDSCFAAVDNASSLTISATTGKNWNNTVKFYVANSRGITFTSAFAPANPNGTGNINYYLKGSGSVTYSDSLGGGVGHVIKQADVSLTGTSQVSSKTLVSFASTTKTFTADAAIKVYGTDGTTLKKTVKLVTVRQAGFAIEDATSTLTTDDSVGSCEIVQCTDGIVLYYVDGDPDTIAAYKPSININFTNGAGNGLTTSADVGLDGYAVPGTSWNNFTIPNNSTEQTFSTVASIDSTGVASTASGVSVTVSGHRGVYRCSNLDAGSNPLHGYVDEGGATGSNTATPTVTITGIPYANYRLIVYHSTDSTNLPFGYDTINGTDFTYVDGVQAIGTTSWGNSGASDSANPIAEGVNTLVSGILSGSTATMVAHRVGTANSASVRGCFAAIQVVEVVVSDTELVIPVTGATTYTVDADKEYEKVIISGTGTLTLDGTGTITTDVLEIENNSAIVMNSSRLAATTVIGKGTAIYDDEVPPTDKGWTDSANWKGTVWIKNKSDITGNSTAGTGVQPNNLGNADSKVKFSGVSGWLEAPITYTPEIVLENDTYDYALKLTNGNSPQSSGENVNRCTIIKKLSGSGKVTCGETTSSWPVLKVYDASAYTGDIDCGSSGTCLVVVFAAENETLPDTLYALFNSAPRSIYISANGSATVASGATWTANSGITVNGTLYANGTLASSAASAVSGSGTIVFTGRLTTPVDGSNETKWWKNANWTGTVQIDSLSGFIGTGTGTVLAPNDYGNTGSTLELKNCSGWLPVNYECTVPLSVAGTLTIGNGYSGIGNAFTIDHLKGNGQITCNGSAPTVLIYVREWSGYTGKIKMDNKMIVFGDDTVTASDLVSGTIYICEGAVVTNLSNSHWEPAASMKVNGTFAVKARSGWTDGKGAVLGENGIINFIGSGVDDHAYNFSNITGSGKILFTNGTGYSMLPSDVNKMPSTDVAVVNDNTESYVVLTCTGTTTIGTLSGSGKFDSRYGNATTRRLAVVQGADSVWSGTFINEDRIGGLYVSAKRGAASKTLTLSGEQTASNDLVVEAATETTDAGSVNLTGTWVGATTVAGTIGGTGTLTGNLTFSAGSTFKAFASDENGLSVSGSIAYPASGTVTVDVSALGAPAEKVVLLTAASESDIDLTKFALADGTNRKYKLAKEGVTLVVKRIKKVLVIVK